MLDDALEILVSFALFKKIQMQILSVKLFFISLDLIVGVFLQDCNLENVYSSSLVDELFLFFLLIELITMNLQFVYNLYASFMVLAQQEIAKSLDVFLLKETSNRSHLDTVITI